MSKSAAQRALQVAIVGHTNTGKTSLLRTLTRNKYFGEVSAQPSTTRHVEAASLGVGRNTVLELYDTPGLEDAIALLETIDAQAGGTREDGPARINAFLRSEPATQRFEQEAKVLRQMLQCDAACYVIDARDPVLAKHRDELAILNSCGIPLLPLLNFVSTPQAQESAWREALSRLGLHVVVSFDTVAPERDGERVFYAKLATLLDARGAVLEQLTSSHEQDSLARRKAASELLADLYIDVAAYRAQVESLESTSIAKQDLEVFNRVVRQREQACVDALLNLYRFTREDVEASNLPFSEGRWQDDLFDPDSLTALGITLTGGAAAGAAAGLGVDLMLGGASLGAGAAIGALLGGGAQTLRRHGRRIGQSLLGALTGSRYLRIDDTVLQVLVTRQLLLVQALEGRGHAAIEQIRLGDTAMLTLWEEGLSKHLGELREHPAWSSMSQSLSWDGKRQAMLESIAGHLQQLVSREVVDEHSKRP
jgi:GTPase SAR1 family protein